MSEPTLKRFGREVERLWSAKFPSARILSRREWDAIERWHAKGVPLGVVAEVIEQIADRRRGQEPRRGLAYLERPVDELWELVSAGRSREEATASPSPDTVDAWRQAIARSEGELSGWLESLLGRHEAGEPAQAIEAELAAELAGRCPPTLVEKVTAEVEATLAPHRERMAPELWRRTVEANRLRRLRRGLGLPILRG